MVLRLDPSWHPINYYRDLFMHQQLQMFHELASQAALWNPLHFCNKQREAVRRSDTASRKPKDNVTLSPFGESGRDMCLSTRWQAGEV